MKNAILTAGMFLCVIGVFEFAIMLIAGPNATTFITQQNINGIILTKFDAWGYIINIKNRFNETPYIQIAQIPEMKWNAIDIVGGTKNVFNIILVALNYTLLYPYNLAMFLSNMIIAILGLNVESGNLKWLGDTMDILNSIHIPYVN